MRVAVVCPYDLSRNGGVQDQSRRLVRWLRNEGHESRLVGPGAAGPDEVDLGSAVRVPVNGSIAPIAVRPGLTRAVARAVSWAEVVHVHEPLVPVVGPAAVRAGLPVVATFHADPPGWVRSAYRVGRAVAARILAPVVVATAVSRVAAEAVSGLVTCRIIPNGLDVDHYAPKGPKMSRRVVFLGRDEPRKGLEVLLRAWPAVHRAVSDATLVLVGPRRDASSLPAGVVAVGRVSEDEKRSILGQAEVFCAPNTGGESFGIVLTEGMAAGCAVVASDIPAFRAVLDAEPGAESRPAGRLVAPSDVGSLTRALIELLTDDEAREGWARVGRDRVRRFDREVVVAQYLAAYRDAVVS